MNRISNVFQRQVIFHLSFRNFFWNEVEEKISGILNPPLMYGFPKQYCVYIMASKRDGVLYIGVTGNLAKRIWEHKNNVIKCFTQKYFVHRLVYFEQTENIYSALTREKQLKKWKRDWKIKLIEKHNPKWKDLSDNL